MTLPLDTSCQAEYADGYIHDETTHEDVSPYTGQHNILNDILEKRPEAEHGKMVRFSVFYKDQRYDIAWPGLPENAKPIRFRDGFYKSNADGTETTGWSGMRFGYEYINSDSENIKKVQEL